MFVTQSVTLVLVTRGHDGLFIGIRGIREISSTEGAFVKCLGILGIPNENNDG